MKIFEEKFSRLFRNKHGEELFVQIKKQIIEEGGNESDDYINKIFDIAYAKFLEIDDKQIGRFLKEMMDSKVENVQELLEKHKRSINQIIRKIEESIPKI